MQSQQTTYKSCTCHFIVAYAFLSALPLLFLDLFICLRRFVNIHKLVSSLIRPSELGSYLSNFDQL